MADLAAFLSARLDEDEAMWRLVAARPRMNRPQTDRMFREVAAKRAIVGWHPSEWMRYIDANRCPQCELTWPCPTVRLIAAVYSDHPDYDPAWAV